MTCPDDNTLAALLEGSLPTEQARTLREHLADCTDCRALVAAGGAPLLAPGTVLDRYVVLHEVGAGAMGVVFAAWDNRLDRKVALKVLHAGTEADRQLRLEREARALARLSHPNVVTVYDVGRSSHGLFVVMEFVEGQTVRQWLTEPRAAAVTLAIFAEAGRGLAAAHAAGLVHRDFKPDNVLLGHDGRARVSDFGLAQLSNATPPRLAVAALSIASLTRTGAQVGTPAYMAPEVFSGTTADARSDQFSFCTSLWEALGGARPFSGASSDELCERIANRKFEATAVHLDARVERALRRGLSLAPGDRFASVEALLVELAPRRSRWPWGVGLAASVALLAAAGVGWPRDECAGAAVQLAEVWSNPHRAALRSAFSDPSAAPSLQIVEAALDRWSERWTRAHIEACQATRRREQSEGLLDKRMQCLDAQAKQTRALVALLGRADRLLVGRAVEAVGELPEVEGCSAAWLEQRVPPPKDRAVIAPLEEALATAGAQAQAGKFAEAREATAALKKRAVALGYKPLEAAVGNLLGRMQERTQDFQGAEATLIEALTASQAGRDDEAAVVALAHLGRVTGVRRSRMEDGLRWVEIGRGALTRLGGSTRLEAQLEASEAAVLKEAGRLGDALSHQDRLVSLLEGSPSQLALAEAWAMRGRLLTELARFAEARGALSKALALQESLLGPDHPDVAVTLNSLGMACRRTGDFDASVKYLERALAISEGAMGRDSLEAAYTLNHLGNVYAVRGDWKKALETFRKVLAIGEKALGAEHHEVGMAHSNLGWTLRWLRRLDEAKAECERARAIVEPKLGADHGYTAEVLHQLGAVLRVQGELEKARALEQRSLEGVTRALGPKHTQLADPLTGIGLCDLALGKRADAAVALERALGLRAGVTPAELGETRLGLARALPDGDARKCPLARQAIEELKAGGAQEVEWASLVAECPQQN